MDLSQIKICCPQCHTWGTLSTRLPNSDRYRFYCHNCKFDGIYVPCQTNRDFTHPVSDLIRQKSGGFSCPTCG